MADKVIVICREFDKYGNRRPLTYIVSRDATGRDLNLLSIRSRFNPELEYYATTISENTIVTDDEILLLAKAKMFREPNFVRL